LPTTTVDNWEKLQDKPTDMPEFGPGSLIFKRPMQPHREFRCVEETAFKQERWHPAIPQKAKPVTETGLEPAAEGSSPLLQCLFPDDGLLNSRDYWREGIESTPMYQSCNVR